MKNRQLSVIAIYTFLLLLFLTSCQNRSKVVNDGTDPEIPDDYSSITGIENYRKWGTYNVHDPSCIKADDGFYYLYSTDAIWFKRGVSHHSDTIRTGNIQVRRSPDLVHWDFIGWALDSIPSDVVAHIEKASGGQKPGGIWAPNIRKYRDEYRLYYCASVFGANTSAIALATSGSPLGPWKERGIVVKTFSQDPVNAIDPSVIIDPESGKHWMHYGSYFGGLSVVELDPETGLAKNEGSLGKIVARRSEGKDRIIEAPEIIYNPGLKKYFLFVSYEPLFTHYNIRVGRSEHPDGPFYDYFGKDLAVPENNYPVLTYAYRFRNHPGWAGTGHCAVINDNGRFFLFHQARLAPDNLMMDLHVREVFWTEDGWPVVSPERYNTVAERSLDKNDITGTWEVIRLNEIFDSTILWQGQIPPGGWHYDTSLFNNSVSIGFMESGETEGLSGEKWSLENQLLTLTDKNGKVMKLILSPGWDWENHRATITGTGLTEKGTGIWLKKSE
ncbi:MAG: arabinan endo-1,5-alpha-L-arabinosidase [Bacteroidota bacterium]